MSLIDPSSKGIICLSNLYENKEENVVNSQNRLMLKSLEGDRDDEHALLLVAVFIIWYEFCLLDWRLKDNCLSSTRIKKSTHLFFQGDPSSRGQSHASQLRMEDVETSQLRQTVG